MPPTLTELVDDAAFLAVEHRSHLRDLHGADSWFVDFAAHTFWFTAHSGEVTTCGVQFLGSAAPGPATWLWGWAYASEYDGEILVAADNARRSGVPELAMAEQPLHAVRQAQESGRHLDRSPVLDDELPYRLALGAMAVNRHYVHYCPVVDSGSQPWFLLDVPGFALPVLDGPRFTSVIVKGLTSVRITDHRRAVLAYARARNLTVESTPHAIQVLFPGGMSTVTFDRLNRIADVTGSLARTDPTR